MGEKDKFLEDVKKAHESKSFKLNGIEFSVTSISFLTRRKIFAYFTSIKDYFEKGDFSFMADENFDKTMNDIDSKITVNGVSVSKDKEFWNNNADIYLEYVTMTLMLFSYPFFAEKITS